MTEFAMWNGADLLRGCHANAENLASLTEDVKQMKHDICMTGMRLHLLRGRIQSLGAPFEAPETQTCTQLLQISTEFRATVRENCALCQGEGGECMVDLLTRSSRRDP